MKGSNKYGTSTDRALYRVLEAHLVDRTVCEVRGDYADDPDTLADLYRLRTFAAQLIDRVSPRITPSKETLLAAGMISQITQHELLELRFNESNDPRVDYLRQCAAYFIHHATSDAPAV